MARVRTPPPRIGTELILWRHVPRHSRRGYLTRDFFIGSRFYRWTSNAITREGLVRYGILDSTHEVRHKRATSARTHTAKNYGPSPAEDLMAR